MTVESVLYSHEGRCACERARRPGLFQDLAPRLGRPRLRAHQV